ncbi:MAG: hypothetical protein ACREV7_20005 [Steroidobacteraceae bacterium]
MAGNKSRRKQGLKFRGVRRTALILVADLHRLLSLLSKQIETISLPYADNAEVSVRGMRKDEVSDFIGWRRRDIRRDGAGYAGLKLLTLGRNADQSVGPALLLADADEQNAAEGIGEGSDCTQAFLVPGLLEIQQIAFLRSVRRRECDACEHFDRGKKLCVAAGSKVILIEVNFSRHMR